MQAIRVHHTGAADVLTYETTEMPQPAENQVLVKVAAAGVNYIDLYQRSGQYSMSLPYTPGLEGAGVVAAIGAGVTQFTVGDTIAWGQQLGSYAAYVTVPEAVLVHVPQGMTLEQAAAVMLQGITAHYLSYSTFPLGPEHTALIHAAAGGVGLLLVQLAKLRGARVIGTVSTPEKAQLALQAGADEVILYTETDFAAETRRITNGQGVNVVYDSVGKDTFDKSLECLCPRGYLVLFGQASGAVPPFDLQRLNSAGSLFITRPTMGHYLLTRAELEWRTGDLFRLIAEGQLNVRIDQTFPLAQAADAHEYMAARRSKGKVLLIP